MVGDSEFKSKPIWERMKIWLKTCNCGEGDKVYCTYCEMLMEAYEYIEHLEGKLNAQTVAPTENKV